MNSKVKYLLFTLASLGFAQCAMAVSFFACLQSITSDPELNNNPHHPEKYFFSLVSGQKKQFLLLQQNKSFLCETDGPIANDSVIDIFTLVPEIKEPRRLSLSLTVVPHDQPQTKSSTVPLENGFLPSHISMLSALETSGSAKSGKKLTAQCKKATDERLIDTELLLMATNEIQDLYADFAEQRDALAYNYDMKEIEKKNTRLQFDLKLKKILELCAAVPELRSVSAAVSRKINLKSNVRINLFNDTSAETSEKKDKLHSGVKQ